MSVLRQFNFLGNMRVDIPHLRTLECSIAADFDAVVGRGLAGDRALVVRGFALANASAGTLVTEMQLVAADSLVYNLNSSESGSFLWIPKDRAPELLSPANPKVSGSFTANTTNYVGIDFKRSADTSTTDLVQFLDSSTLIESPRSVPLGRTLDYVILISTAPFSTSTNITPIAKVVTDINNKVVSIQDARPLMYRLGSGGDFPNAQNAFSYPFGRKESTSTTAFTGGDKNIQSEKDWKDAVMTRIWELGGGETWYAATADRNVRLIRTSASVFSNGENFELVTTHLHWKGLTMVFDNANNTGVYYNEIQDQLVNDVSPELKTDLAVGECVYVDIDRTQNLTGGGALVAHKAPMRDLGTPVVPGSRYIIAWRSQDAGTVRIYTRDYPYVIGQTFSAATTSSLGTVRVSRAPLVLGIPIAIATTGGSIVSIVADTEGLNVTGLGNNYGLIATGGDAVDQAGIYTVGGCTTDISNGIEAQGGPAGGLGIKATGTGPVPGGRFYAGSSGNPHGADGYGYGTGAGLYGLGGGSAGAHGVWGQGGVGGGHGVYGKSSGTYAGVHGEAFSIMNAYGVEGLGAGTGAGVFGQGGSTGGGMYGVGGAGGPGMYGVGGATDQSGVIGRGTGAGRGVWGIGGATADSGVFGYGGTGSGYGVYGVGADTNGTGVEGVGNGATGIGVYGQGGTTGTGVHGYAHGAGAKGTYGLSDGGNGTGVRGDETGGGGSGYGVYGNSTNGIGVKGYSTANYGGQFSSAGSSAIDIGTGHAYFSGGNLASMAAVGNAVTPSNICKCWGIVDLDGAGGCTVIDGFNISGVGFNGNWLRVVMAYPMANTQKMAVICTISHRESQTSSILVIHSCNFTNTTFDIGAVTCTTGVQVNLGAVASSISFTVFGNQ